MITDAVSIPDHNIICVSSTEREIRFYETTARDFLLQGLVKNIDYAIIAMHYHFFPDEDDDLKNYANANGSKKHKRRHQYDCYDSDSSAASQDSIKTGVLIAADMAGNIKLFELDSEGIFREEPADLETDYIVINFPELIGPDFVNGIMYRECSQVHSPYWSTKLGFDAANNWIVSCCNNDQQVSFTLIDYERLEPVYILSRLEAISCFYILDGKSKIVTGSKDYIVRMWSLETEERPLMLLKGHQAPIKLIFSQGNGRLIYTLDKEKTIKVWDTDKAWCIQTVPHKLDEIGNFDPVSFYNPWARTLYVGNLFIMSLKIGYDVDPNYTDGYTHSKPVTKILVHPKMKAVVTMGMDSSILIWNPLTGKRLASIWHAHSKMQEGEYLPVGITAATFSPSFMYLLTGAIDGTIKMWDFFTFTCVRTMVFAKYSQVTSLIWVPHRILAAGWARYVTEWEDSRDVGPAKIWPKSHCDSINHAALLWPIGVVTSSEVGELIFNRISTGQPYKRNLVSRPADSFLSNIVPEDFERRPSQSPYTPSGRRKSSEMRSSVAPGVRRASIIEMPEPQLNMEKIAVKCLLRLKCRPMDPQVGSLLVSLQTGYIQLWSHHPVGGFMQSIYAIHTSADYVSVMKTTAKNKYLFTGHADGYVKVWLLTNFGVPGPKKHICWPKLRLQFPFLIKDRLPRRATRAVKIQKEPPLLSSFRAHVSGITDLDIMEENRLFATGSYDKSVRIWTYGGQYIGTLGTFWPYQQMPLDKIAHVKEINMPIDVKKVASSTTLKVMSDGYRHLKKTGVKSGELVRFERMINSRKLKEPIYGSHPERPILGKFYSVKWCTRTSYRPPKFSLTNVAGIRVFNNYKPYRIEYISPPIKPRCFAREGPLPKMLTFSDSKDEIPVARLSELDDHSEEEIHTDEVMVLGVGESDLTREESKEEMNEMESLEEMTKTNPVSDSYLMDGQTNSEEQESILPGTSNQSGNFTE